ncbi:MAG: DUF89 family protein [Deltaproteobacteria bacterium]|nr:DUF89 family protein [Deltaproteobacteria bacterium]
MLIWPDCIHCTLRMAVNIARIAAENEAQVKKFIKEILKLDYYSGNRWDITSPEIIRDVWLIMQNIFSVNDPLKNIKKQQNDAARTIYPFAEEIVSKSPDPFQESLKFAISGNAIDIMTGLKENPTRQNIETIEKGSISHESIMGFKDRLSKSRSLVYLGDNCGEIFFDRLFIETLLDYYDLKVTFVSRTVPVLNDAIMENALQAGLDKVAEVVENGTNEPIPGTMLDRVSPVVKSLISEADIVISKGGGNYDSLSEEKGLMGKCTFLIQSKCEPYALIHSVPVGDLIVSNF